MKTSELKGRALDWAVAKALGFVKINIWTLNRIGVCKTYSFEEEEYWHPSDNWSQAGPIIERERIAIFARGGMGAPLWAAEMRECAEHWIDTTVYEADANGSTPLIAAMRAFVASKLGDEVEIPQELIK